MINFEGKEKREAAINECLKKYDIKDLEQAVNDGIIPEEKIDISVNKIFNLKQEYGIIQ